MEKSPVFDTPNGKATLDDLFDGRSQLIVYHFMFGPSVRDGKEGCESCSFLVDHVDGANVHLAHHDVTFVAISRTPLSQIEPFKNRMGWRFKWVSSYGSDFNYDFHVSATKDELAQGRMYYNYEIVEFQCEEQPGISVFYKDKTGDIIFRHRRPVIPFAAKQKANTPTNIKTTNAIHISNHELRQKTGNSSTIVNSAEMVANKPMIAVKTIDFCNTW